MNKGVIYTFIAGKYDDLQAHTVKSDQWDYICFSTELYNRGKREINGWQIRPIPFKHKDPKREISYPKLLPHRLLAEYEYSLAVDANIDIMSMEFFHRLDELINDKIEVGHMDHTQRDCVYEEAYTLNSEAGAIYKSDFFSLLRCYRFLRREGYPEHYGLYENNVIFRRHNLPKVKEAMELWWKLYMRFDRRDQAEGKYYYWKTGIHPAFILPKGHNARNTPDIILCRPHATPLPYPHFEPGMTKTEYWKTFFRAKMFHLRVHIRRFLAAKLLK